MSRRARGFAAVKDRVVRVPFRVLIGATIPKTVSSAFTELEIVPANLGSRVVAIAPNFEYYRVTQLNLSVISSVANAVHYDSDILNVTLGTLGGYMGIAYEPSDTTRTAVPTSFGGLANSAVFDFGNFKHRFSVNVPKSVLLGTPIKWWNTTSTGSPTETLVQGLVWTGVSNYNENSATTADGMIYCVQGTIEFKGMIDPSLAASITDSASISRPVLEAKRPPPLETQGDEDGDVISETVTLNTQKPVLPAAVKKGWVTLASKAQPLDGPAHR